MNISPLLVVAALDEVVALRATAFSGDDSTVLRLLSEYGDGSDLANLLWDDLPAGWGRERRQDVCDLLSLWVWRTRDNGSRIRETQEAWMRECSNPDKAWIALHREGVPFSTNPGLVDRVATKFPELADICREANRNRAR